MSSFLTFDESDSTLSHDLPLQWPQVPRPTGDGPEPMRWIVNPPSSAFCHLPPGQPGQTKTSQGVEKTALIVKRSIVVSTDDAALLCVCVCGSGKNNDRATTIEAESQSDPPSPLTYTEPP